MELCSKQLIEYLLAVVSVWSFQIDEYLLAAVLVLVLVVLLTSLPLLLRLRLKLMVAGVLSMGLPLVSLSRRPLVHNAWSGTQ